jgi:hypothetical protein
MRAGLVALLCLGIPTLAKGQAAGARVPVLLPAPAAMLAQALELSSARPATILIDTVRLVYATSDQRLRQRAAAALARTLDADAAATTEVAPLPLDAAIWRDVILGVQAPDDRLAAAILRDRGASLMYLGLSAVDDETLGWLAAHTETIRLARKRPALFAAFGRSLRIRNGVVEVPGGTDAAALWTALVGASPDNPADFAARLFGDAGRLAFFYDTVVHLDAARQRFALGLTLPASLREDRLRTLMRAFAAAAPEWRADEQPFGRPPLDGAILLSTVAVLPDGSLAPPIERRLWERVFRGDALNEVPFVAASKTEIDAMSAGLTVDAAWLATRILTEPYAVGRRRLDLLLFAQRVFGPRHDGDRALVATALRGCASFPALMAALERGGVTDPATFAAAAVHADRLGAVRSLTIRRTAIAQFQSAVALIQESVRSGTLDASLAERLISALSSLAVSPRDGYGGRFAAWFRDDFMRVLPPAGDSVEDTVLAAVAGASARRPDPPRVTWEERSYVVDPAAAGLRRLQFIRARQRGTPLDAALSKGDTLAEALVSIVYAAHLGDPGGMAVTSGNVAARHDFGLTTGSAGSASAWLLPVEDFNRRTSWRIHGSLLGLEIALSRLTLRRLNPAEMPAEPKIGPQDRQTVMLTIALMNPFAMSNDARDAIADAIRRGRARADALPRSVDAIDEAARDAGLSEWRRRALEWEIGRGAGSAASRFSLLELLWLGRGGGDIPAGWDAWGAAVLPLTGCVCLEMPRLRAWEEDAGYASAVLGTRGADVGLRVAEALADFQLPASLAPSLAGYAMQDVLDHARLSHADDWDEFGRAVRELPRERMVDYVAALSAGGPLVPVTKDENTPRNP